MRLLLFSALLGLTAAIQPISPTITEHPTNVTSSPGSSVQFNCKGRGSPTPNILIIKEDNVGDWEQVDSEPGRGTRANNHVTVYREFTDLKWADEGWYVCIVSNKLGISTSRAYLDIVQDPCETVECPKRQSCVPDYENQVGECRCRACTDRRYRPVCGSDCNNYFNPCHMREHSCEQSLWLNVEHKGTCAPREQLQLHVGEPVREVFEGESLTLTCSTTGTPAADNVKWVRVNAKGRQRVEETGPELVIQAADMTDAGTYKCLATQCQEKIGSSQVEVRVISNAADDPVREMRTCKVFGDPHIQSFDGRNYDFMGHCQYIIATDCENYMWTLIGLFRPCGDGVTCLENLDLYYGSSGISLTRGWIVSARSEKYRLRKNKPVQIGEFNVRYTGLSVDVTMPNGVDISWDGFWGVQIRSPAENAMCGLCGDNNGDPGNDVSETRFSKPTDDVITTFGQSWVHGRGHRVSWCEAPALPEGQVACKNLEQVQDTCERILDSPVFSDCVEALGRDTYRTSCVVDTCATRVPRFFLPSECAFAHTLAQHCRVAGFNPGQAYLEQVGCGSTEEFQAAVYESGCPLDDYIPYLD